MAAVLAPWPWLDGGATAVLVATVFDGATVDEELLWRGGRRVAARLGGEPLGDDALEVRLGAYGFELAMPRACDGEVAVGGRAEALRELSLCGVTVLPLGPRTRVTVRAGLTTFVVAGTTPPKKVPLAPPVSWRRRAGLAVAALAGAAFVAAVNATAPRTPSWTIPDTVRVKVALMMPSLHGGRAASLARDTRAKRAAATTTAKSAAQPTTNAERAHAQQELPNRDRAPRLLASRGGERPTPASVDDARRAAAMQARAAGVVGVLAQYRASFLGDVHVAASQSFDTGSIALGSGDASSGNASASGSGSDGASSSGTGNGDGSGALAGDEVGEAYGEGGLGLSGGGGGGDGTIGVGDLGTIGRGDGSGTGVGYGSAAGGLGGRSATMPEVVAGSAAVRGSCDKDLIRRVVRAHVNELRFCYERVLQSRPTLAGRVATRFVIGFDGRVTSSAIAASALTPAVDACVADAIRRWQFEPRCVGEVAYPFVFEPIASAP